MGCTLQAYKACVCPAIRLKKEPGVSHRDISGLLDRRFLQFWSDTPLYTAKRGQDTAAVFAAGGRRRLPVFGGNDIRLAYWLPRHIGSY